MSRTEGAAWSEEGIFFMISWTAAWRSWKVGSEYAIRRDHDVDHVPVVLDEHLVVGEGGGPDVRDAGLPDRSPRSMLSAGGGEQRSGSVGRTSGVSDIIGGSGVPCRGSCAIGDSFPLEDPEIVVLDRRGVGDQGSDGVKLVPAWSPLWKSTRLVLPILSRGDKGGA